MLNSIYEKNSFIYFYIHVHKLIHKKPSSMKVSNNSISTEPWTHKDLSLCIDLNYPSPFLDVNMKQELREKNGKEFDGLKQDWSGEVAYIHPLFDTNIWRWVKKAYETKNFTGVCLLPASVHSKYFHEWIYHNPNCEIRFLQKPSREGFRFGHDDGKPDINRVGYIKPLMVVIFKNK